MQRPVRWPQEQETPQYPPTMPQNLTATVNEDDSITLVWDAPEDDSITATRYCGDSPRRRVRSEHPRSGHRQHGHHLHGHDGDGASTLHVYRVKAINSAGVSQQYKNDKVTP